MKFYGHMHASSNVSFNQAGYLVSARGMGKSQWMAAQREVLERQMKLDNAERLTKGTLIRDILVKLRMIDHIELEKLKNFFEQKNSSFEACIAFGNIVIRVANHHSRPKRKELRRTVWYLYHFDPAGVKCEVRASDKKVLSKTYPFNLDGFLDLKRDFQDKYGFLDGHVIFRN